MKPFMKYGLIVAATGILLTMIIYLIGLDKSDTGQYLGWLNVLISIIAMIYAIKEKREKDLGGFISFGQAFGTGAKMVVVASAITAIFTYIYMSFINPSLHDYLLQKQVEKMEGRGMAQEQIDTTMSYTEKFMTPVMMSVFTLIMGIIFGIIIALIIAAIVKKPNPNPFENAPDNA